MRGGPEQDVGMPAEARGGLGAQGGRGKPAEGLGIRSKPWEVWGSSGKVWGGPERAREGPGKPWEAPAGPGRAQGSPGEPKRGPIPTWRWCFGGCP